MIILLLFIPLFAFSSVNPTPLLPHKDADNEREFQNVYQNMAKSPTIYTSTNVPTTAPQKAGDFFINTSTAKIYISTGNVSSGAWVPLN